MCRLYDVHAEHFVDFRLLEFVYFQSSAVKGGVNRLYVRFIQFEAVFGHVKAAKTSFLHVLILGKRVQNFLRIFGVMYISIDVFSPVCIQLIVIDGLDFLACAHLVF